MENNLMEIRKMYVESYLSNQLVNIFFANDSELYEPFINAGKDAQERLVQAVATEAATIIEEAERGDGVLLFEVLDDLLHAYIEEQYLHSLN